MPELPEVETIRRDLQRALPGRILQGVDVRLPKIVAKEGQRRILWPIQSSVQAVHRRAKVLLFHFSSHQTMIIHLKMSGQLIWSPVRGKMRVGGHPIPGGVVDLPNRFSHVIFKFAGGVLYFNDQRQFGYVRLIPTTDLPDWLEKQGYGPEPLETHFTFDNFQALLKKFSKRRLKAFLLDQKIIAGIGNIYADEACFFARVRPMRRISSLSQTERRALYRGIRSVLERSIIKRGTSADSYRDANGKKGGMMPFLNVYGREGQACRRCGALIKRIVYQQRGTRYCPGCQR